ncbi:hypothetical protein GGTG_12364 [Gaeumannomyces tritici R3-111a-1]|uniref:Uncharacterized protein n=1 Tax=Gaeumannomyces tritici (strain R3-111a-1) TaxID=644352 RepID=J3PFT9_GAET3|nr:hypothetical protein GGTG_12364 [Gaeumannomyces tritici R3-111a-1]EJT70191.1 hypothetical protein GGTG_12364 [Gaeumannomyces tritici R3-111a-1]
MAVQAQWSLDTTPGSAISLLSGVIQAATTDNVQAIALLACERFGSTLAMSDETMSKIETSVVPTPPSIPIRFLQAKIGFSKHDSAVQLGKSKAGVRFLGLATALITTMKPMQAAKALDLMLSKSAADSTQLPTLRQLRDLLLALEPRCQTAGFADSVHGWGLLVALDRWPEDLQLDIGYLEMIYHPLFDVTSRDPAGSPTKILEGVLKLVGHLGDKAHDRYVASAMRGQVVYPSIFETSQIRKHGFLSLDHYRGKLMYKNDEYSSVVGHGPFVKSHESSESDSARLGRPVDRPCNLFVDRRVSWEVAEEANGSAEIQQKY